jgi:uncharacterized protein YuzE
VLAVRGARLLGHATRLFPDRNRAYLLLDEGAAVVNRPVFTEEDDREAWGINLDFDAAGHFVGVEFERADGQVPEGLLRGGEGLRVEYDEEAGAGFLYLQMIPPGGVDNTLAFGEEATRPA